MLLFAWREFSCSFLIFQVQILLAHIYQGIRQILKLDLQAHHELSLLLVTHLLVLPYLVFLVAFLLEQVYNNNILQ